jgi:hypothetical protein
MKKALKVVCGVVGATVLVTGAAVAALELTDLYHECKRKNRDKDVAPEDDFDDFDDFDEDLDTPDAPPVKNEVDPEPVVNPNPTEAPAETPSEDTTPAEESVASAEAETPNVEISNTEELTQEQKIEKAFEPVNS